MNIYVPFICLAAGAAINWKGLPAPVIKVFDFVTNTALIVLMLVIGLNIGVSDKVMGNLGSIGFNCLAISFTAIVMSVFFVVVAEKTVMPLEEIRLKLLQEADAASRREFGSVNKESKEDSHFSPLIVIMPLCIAIGIISGYFIFSQIPSSVLDTILTVSLIFLYTGVGVSIGSNKEVFSYIRNLGARIIFMPLAIFAGCLMGGFISGLLLGVPLQWSVLSASGMGYYSLAGAFLTENFGIEAGTYGFIVNVSREVFTVLLLPLLTRISKGSPIASGAAGCMDTMLVPVAKAVGPELGMAALISGTILTFVIPIWLPVGMLLL